SLGLSAAMVDELPAVAHRTELARLPAQKVSLEQAWAEGKAHAHVMAHGCEPLEIGHTLRVVVADPEGRPLSDGAPMSNLVLHAPQLRTDHGPLIALTRKPTSACWPLS